MNRRDLLKAACAIPFVGPALAAVVSRPAVAAPVSPAVDVVPSILASQYPPSSFDFFEMKRAVRRATMRRGGPRPNSIIVSPQLKKFLVGVVNEHNSSLGSFSQAAESDELRFCQLPIVVGRVRIWEFGYGEQGLSHERQG